MGVLMLIDDAFVGRTTVRKEPLADTVCLVLDEDTFETMFEMDGMD